MPVGLEIELSPERLSDGSPEERAAFGLLRISAANASLTEGFDFFTNSYRRGPLISGYHLAEWLAWNWWRQRWEGRSAAADWDQVHRMSSIGEGYVWPNLTMWSDGLRTALISNPSTRRDAKPFRYVGALPVIVPSSMFEAAIDAFVPQVLSRLDDEGVAHSNLDRLWSDVLAERSDPEIAKRRRLEAYLGRDPDTVDDDRIETLLRDGERLGESALEEVAADAAQRGAVAPALTADEFEALSVNNGHDASPRDSVRLDAEHQIAKGSDVPAWLFGVRAAQAIRHQEGLGHTAISDLRLAQLAGTGVDTLEDAAARTPLSFSLDEGPLASRIVLRSKWKEGRRFDLARLIGDRLFDMGSALHPATRSSTYRQKAQRAFAAEFLSPFEEVDEMLAGDYSTDNQQDVAEHFAVSPQTIDTMLKNHGRVPRDYDHDFETMVAA